MTHQESNSGDHAAQPKTSREQGGRAEATRLTTGRRSHWLFTKSVSPYRAHARELEYHRLSRLSQLGSVTDVTDAQRMSIGRRCLS